MEKVYYLTAKTKKTKKYPKNHIYMFGDIIVADKTTKRIMESAYYNFLDQKEQSNYYRHEFLKIKNMSIFEFILMKFRIIKIHVMNFFKHPFLKELKTLSNATPFTMQDVRILAKALLNFSGTNVAYKKNNK